MPAPVESKSLFQAQWPKSLDPALQSSAQKISKVFWNIISVVIFPIGLVRLAGHYLRNLAFRLIIPGDLDFNIGLYEAKDLPEKLGGQTVQIETPDGAKIDGAFIPGRRQEKVVLIEGGNCEMWQSSLVDWERRIKPTGTSLLFMNPRGVGKSTGVRNSEGYALDVYTAAEYLIQEKGIDPENILFAGFSMGAANTTRGAALIQEKYPDKKIQALNINSFSSLETEIYEMAGIFGYLASKLLGLNKDVKKAWDTLKGKKIILHNPNDPVIPFPAQLATAVKKDPVGTTHVAPLSQKPRHSAFGNKESRKTLQLALRHLLAQPTWWPLRAQLEAKTYCPVAL